MAIATPEGPPKDKLIIFFIVILLFGQNTMQTFLLRYSKTLATPKEQYIASVSVIVVELLKIFICSLVVLVTEKSENLFSLFQDSKYAHRSVPSILFIIQNNLIHLGIATIDNSNISHYKKLSADMDSFILNLSTWQKLFFAKVDMSFSFIFWYCFESI